MKELEEKLAVTTQEKQILEERVSFNEITYLMRSPLISGTSGLYLFTEWLKRESK